MHLREHLGLLLGAEAATMTSDSAEFSFSFLHELVSQHAQPGMSSSNNLLAPFAC